MSVITEQASAFELDAVIDERHLHRYTGFLVTISASVLLWGGIGTGIWGLVSLFG